MHTNADMPQGVSETTVSNVPPKKRKKSTLKRRENLTALAFISIKYFGLIVFTVLPVIFALLYSFTNYNARFETEPFLTRIGALWCNFENYKKLRRLCGEFKRCQSVQCQR